MSSIPTKIVEIFATVSILYVPLMRSQLFGEQFESDKPDITWHKRLHKTQHYSFSENQLLKIKISSDF